MGRDTFIVFADAAGWRTARVRGGALEIKELAADQAAAGLRESGHSGQGVMLVIPSEWCLSARISLEGLARSDRRAMLYRLEEKLPLAAEEVVVDFIPSADGRTALGVCTRLDRVRPVVDALEASGVTVEAIAPLALLVAQELGGGDPLVVGEGPRVSVVRFEEGRPAAWSLIAADPADLRLELAAADAAGARSIGVAESVLAALSTDVRRIEGDVTAVAAKAAARAMEGRDKAWINLRRDALAAGDRLRTYRAALNAALAGAAVFLLALAAGALVRGQRYHRQAVEHEQQIVEAFSAHFPGWEVPGDVRGVVESEHRKAMAHSADALPAEARGSALLSLRDVLGKVSAADGKARFRVERLRFTESSFELDGRARSPEDVQPLVAAAKAAGMEVALPQTRREDDGMWAFSVRGARPAAPDAVAAGGRP